MRSLLRKIENYPIGMCGTALGFITLSNCYDNLGFTYIKSVALIFAIIAIYLMVLRGIFYPNKIVEELKNPIAGSFYPTFDMTLFLISASTYSISPLLGKVLWIISVVVHAAIFLIFLGFRARNFKLEYLFPSWFIILVGMITGTIAGKDMGYPTVSKILFLVGLVLYFVAWPFVLYRLFKRRDIKENDMATIGVLAAPASLCILGYFALTDNPNIYLLVVLFVTSIFNLICVYVKMPRCFNKKFDGILAAFTFPLAISNLAILRVANFADFMGYSTWGVILRGAGIAELVISTVVIAYLIINFLILFIKAIINSKNNKENLKSYN